MRSAGWDRSWSSREGRVSFLFHGFNDQALMGAGEMSINLVLICTFPSEM